MEPFRYRAGDLWCESVRVADIAARVGTPCYVYSHRGLVDRYRDLVRALAPLRPLICFAMKANGNLAVCRTLVRAGAGLDIVSGGELYRALRVGADPRRIVFAGVGKTDVDIRAAIRRRILLFNVESAAELGVIDALARAQRRVVDISLRVNPDVDPGTHHAITTGRAENKFGVTLDQAAALFAGARSFRHVRMAGLHVHIGSQITRVRPFVAALRKVLALAERIRRAGHRLEWLNVGGGLGIRYRDEPPLTAAAYARAVVPVLRGCGLRVILEPGRFIVGNSGILVTRVLYVKETPRKRFVIVDAGMNDLSRPALYGAYHELVPVEAVGGPPVERAAVVDVVGPVCESADVLARDRRLPGVGRGALLAVLGAGAYGYTMASNYNSRPRPPEVLVMGRELHVVKPREQWRDLVRGEVIPPRLR